MSIAIQNRSRVHRHGRAAAALLTLLAAGCQPPARSHESSAPTRAPGGSAPVTVTVPTAPIPVRAAGSTVLVYELHIANAGTRPLRLERVEVRASSNPQSAIVTYDRRAIANDVKFLAPRGAPLPKALDPGVQAIVYLWIALDSAAGVPSALSHHIVFADGDTAPTSPIPVGRGSDLVFAPPIGEGDWWIGLGPSNTSEHRRSVLRVGDDTVPHLAQRFAIDWVKMDARGEYARDHNGRANTDWYGYGEPVKAVADARVAGIVDGIPDNVPGENSRAVAMTVGTVLGNSVLLDLGRGTGAMHRYALYGHLKPGTIQVRAGDRVVRGQLLGNIGNSGNSDGPHLHFHVTEAPDDASAPLRSEGIPFVIDAFSVVAHDPDRVSQKAALTPLGAQRLALPVEGDVIRLGPP